MNSGKSLKLLQDLIVRALGIAGSGIKESTTVYFLAVRNIKSGILEKLIESSEQNSYLVFLVPRLPLYKMSCEELFQLKYLGFVNSRGHGYSNSMPTDYIH